MTKDETLKLALEKIRAAQKCHSNAVVTLLCEADEIIEEALEKPEKEPIAYINVEERKLEWATKFLKWDVPTTIKISKIPLYTTPPAAQRPFVGLTDEERTEIRREHYARTLPLMDAVEAKLKELNT